MRKLLLNKRNYVKIAKCESTFIKRVIKENKMANIKSAEKRVLTIRKKKMENQMVRSRMNTAVKKFNAAISNNDLETAQKLLPLTASEIDTAAKKNIIHKNAANHKKAQIAKALYQLQHGIIVIKVDAKTMKQTEQKEAAKRKAQEEQAIKAERNKARQEKEAQKTPAPKKPAAAAKKAPAVKKEPAKKAAEAKAPAKKAKPKAPKTQEQTDEDEIK